MNNDAIDISDNNNNGKIIGGVINTEDRFGNPCGALHFNGVDGYIEVPSSPSLKMPNNSISVTCWFKIEPSPNQKQWLTLVCKGDQQSETFTNPEYRLQVLQSDTSTISISTDFTEYDQEFKNHRFEYGVWSFYAMTYDGIAVRTFLNGQKIWEFAYSKPFEGNDLPLNIAKDVPGATEYFLGSLDDLRIYSSALSQTEINDIYHDESYSSYSEAFTMNCPNDIIVNADHSICAAIVQFQSPSVITNCGTTKVTQIEGLKSGSKFPIGISTIAYTAINSTGLSEACNFRIIVKNNSLPRINCPNDTIITLTNGSQQVEVKYKMPTASEACKNVKVSLVSGIQSGGDFPIGTTTNTFNAIDDFGNAASCGFNVTVISKPPAPPPPAPIVVAPVTTQKKTDPQQVSIDTSSAQVSQPSTVLQDDTSVNTVTPLATIPDSSEVKPIPVDKEGSVSSISKAIGDSIKVAHQLTFNNCTITAVIYDDAEQDNDTISIFFNKKEIVNRQMITNRKNGTINKVIVLKPGDGSYLIAKAWNNGLIRPNTLRIDFFEGDILANKKELKKGIPFQSKTLHSSPGSAEAIFINCNK